MDNILCQLLECGFLDVNYLAELCKNNSIELDIEDIKLNYGRTNINCLIYEALQQIAQRFISENQDEICKILGVSSELLENDELYEIFTNYLDSHLWFKNEEIQGLFEKSKYQV